jgi:hypothetical protein
VIAGDEAIKAGGTRYLPKLDGQTAQDYSEYVNRGFFYNATARTLAGYLGMIFRKEPVVNCGLRPPTPRLRRTGNADCGFSESLNTERRNRKPAWATVFENDCDLLGSALADYARSVVEEVISVGRCGTLVEWADEPEDRPYFVSFKAENILNWRQSRVNGRVELSLVVLREWVAEENGDAFEPEMVEQIRVLRLVSSDQLSGELSVSGQLSVEGPHYEVEVWRLLGEGDKKEWVVVDRKVPMRRGKPLPAIPFIFHGPVHSRPEVQKSPLADMIAANLDHYRVNADYKHGMHYTALPTAILCGFDTTAELRVGSRTAWISENTLAKASYLEFKGEGLATHERAMDRIERLLSLLGSRLLENSKRASESAEALSIRVSGEHSIVGGLAKSVSASLTQALRWAHWWSSSVSRLEDLSSVLIELNTDFETAQMTAPELQALVAAWQAGGISQETLLHNLRHGEVLAPGTTTDEEMRRIGNKDPDFEHQARHGSKDG